MSDRIQLVKVRELKVVYVYRRPFWACSRCAWRLRGHDSVPNVAALRAFEAHACELYLAGKKTKSEMAIPAASTSQRAS